MDAFSPQIPGQQTQHIVPSQFQPQVPANVTMQIPQQVHPGAHIQSHPPPGFSSPPPGFPGQVVYVAQPHGTNYAFPQLQPQTTVVLQSDGVPLLVNQGVQMQQLPPATHEPARVSSFSVQQSGEDVPRIYKPYWSMGMIIYFITVNAIPIVFIIWALIFGAVETGNNVVVGSLGFYFLLYIGMISVVYGMHFPRELRVYSTGHFQLKTLCGSHSLTDAVTIERMSPCCFLTFHRKRGLPTSCDMVFIKPPSCCTAAILFAPENVDHFMADCRNLRGGGVTVL